MCVVLCHDDLQYTWYSARNMCLHGNGDLISFDDVQTTGNVMARVEERFGSTQHVMWIGLARNLWSWKLHNGQCSRGESIWESNGICSVCLSLSLSIYLSMHTHAHTHTHTHERYSLRV